MKPLNLKFKDDIDPERIVLYREDYREIAPIDFSRQKTYHPKYYIIEISRSRYKLYIIAVKIPNKHLDLVMNGKFIYHLASSPKSKVYY